MRNDFVVRRLASGFTLPPKAGARGQKTLTLKLHPTWKVANLGAAAFLQDEASLRIYGAAVAAVRATPQNP